MKKSLVLSICAILMASMTTFAQNTPTSAPTCNKEKAECSKQCHQPQILTPATIAMLKEEFFKENLKLNDKQKDAFWKSYNKYENAKKQACENAKAAREKAGLPARQGCKSSQSVKFTDEQKVACYKIQLEKRHDMLTAEYTFLEEISKTLTAEQVAQYLDLEKAFEMQMAKLGGKGCGQHEGCGQHGGEGQHQGCGQQCGEGHGPHSGMTPGHDCKMPAPKPVQEK